MTEINTFSAAVDEAVTRAGRPDRRADVISFVRMTMRELQTMKGYMFESDLIEDQITATAEPYIWTPDAATQKRLRIVLSVQYPEIYAPNGKPIYATYTKPNKRQSELDYYYYRSGSSFVFAGMAANTVGAISVPINIAYYAYVPNIAYYTKDDRPATFSLETDEWSYLTAESKDKMAAAELLVTNWLLERWYDAVVEGALAKLFKTVDDARSKSSFALYSSYKESIRMAEPRMAVSGNH